MGNCIRHETAMQWGGDDWGSVFSRNEYDDDDDEDDGDVVVMGGSNRRRRRKGRRSKKEVKIRMSKKQLEQMLWKMDVKDKVSVGQVIAELVRMSEHHQRSWRPDLNSIPEI